MIDHDIRKAALKHFMGGEWIGRIFPNHLRATEQIGDMSKSLALWGRFDPPRLTAHLSVLSDVHMGLPSLVAKYMTYDASKFKGTKVFRDCSALAYFRPFTHT
ncbi:MAG: hypothetical protein QOD11_2284 [Bradyrhizobium sp.]|nr:hypothetical protein [Bradyrhizobium sp.]